MVKGIGREKNMRKTIAVLMVAFCLLFLPGYNSGGSGGLNANSSNQASTIPATSSGPMGFMQAQITRTRTFVMGQFSALDGVFREGEKDLMVQKEDVSSVSASTYAIPSSEKDQQDQIALGQSSSQDFFKNSTCRSPGDPDQEGFRTQTEMDTKIQVDASSYFQIADSPSTRIASTDAKNFAGSPPVIETQGFHVAIEEIEMQTEMQNYNPLKMQKEDLIHYA